MQRCGAEADEVAEDTVLASLHRCRLQDGRLTWNDVARIHRIFVLDKAEAIHELDFGNLARAMGVEVVLNIGLGSCKYTVQLAMPEVQASLCQASRLRVHPSRAANDKDEGWGVSGRGKIIRQ